MDVEACYAAMGADYGEAIRLFKTDEKIVKYFRILQRDTSLDDVCAALERQDYEAAFRAAHTLKGLALNMHFTQLARHAAELTEALRGRTGHEGIAAPLEETRRAHRTMLECIGNF